MYGTIATAALLGLSGVAYARPMAQAASTPLTIEATASSFPTLASANAQVASATNFNGAISTEGVRQGDVFKFPLGNGFPEIDNPSAALNKIEQQAHGQLSNAPPPPKGGLQPDTVNANAFVAFNELFEVAYFSDLLHNVSTNQHGFQQADLLGQDRNTIITNLKVIVAQEELHALNAEGVVKGQLGVELQPCTYNFPVDNFRDAIELASTFTDVVSGVLPDIQTLLGADGDFGAIRGVGAALANEGEQNGFYRTILGKTPSQLPFLTAAARNFGFNAILQTFVVECPKATLDLLEHPAKGIPLNETGILNVLTKDLSIEKDVVAEFSVQTIDISQTKKYYEQHKDQITALTYINQQNVPLSVDITDVSFASNAITFKASFPGQSKFLNGLTIAAVTKGNKFATVDDVASATLFGPGLIEIN
jgi:hypothetical protein